VLGDVGGGGVNEMKKHRIGFQEYRALPGINASSIKHGAVSMLHMHHAMTGGDIIDTPAMRWGRLVHLAILEPEKYGRTVSIWNDGRRAGKAWNDFVTASGGTEWIATAEENASLLSLSASVHSNREAHWLIASSEHELSVTWSGERYGCGKARLDMIDREHGKWVADLKTTRRIDSFSRAFFSLRYDIQCGWYVEGTGATQVFILAVESDPPYDVQTYRVPQSVIDKGRETAIEIARTYRAHKITNTFTGVGGGVDVLELPIPPWYLGGENAEISMEGVMA
jgi:hypothetical protein